MAIITCEKGMQLFDTEAMIHVFKQKIGSALPEVTSKNLEKTVPVELEAKTVIFCKRVCANHGCQAKAHGSKPVSLFIAHEVMQDLVKKVSNKPDPGDNGHLSITSPGIE